MPCKEVGARLERLGLRKTAAGRLSRPDMQAKLVDAEIARTAHNVQSIAFKLTAQSQKWTEVALRLALDNAVAFFLKPWVPECCSADDVQTVVEKAAKLRVRLTHYAFSGTAETQRGFLLCVEGFVAQYESAVSRTDLWDGCPRTWTEAARQALKRLRRCASSAESAIAHASLSCLQVEASEKSMVRLHSNLYVSMGLSDFIEVGSATEEEIADSEALRRFPPDLLASIGTAMASLLQSAQKVLNTRKRKRECEEEKCCLCLETRQEVSQRAVGNVFVHCSSSEATTCRKWLPNTFILYINHLLSCAVCSRVCRQVVGPRKWLSVQVRPLPRALAHVHDRQSHKAVAQEQRVLLLCKGFPYFAGREKRG